MLHLAETKLFSSVVVSASHCVNGFDQHGLENYSGWRERLEAKYEAVQEDLSWSGQKVQQDNRTDHNGQAPVERFDMNGT